MVHHQPKYLFHHHRKLKVVNSRASKLLWYRKHNKEVDHLLLQLETSRYSNPRTSKLKANSNHNTSCSPAEDQELNHRGLGKVIDSEV
jgi:hypothetical protein